MFDTISNEHTDAAPQPAALQVGLEVEIKHGCLTGLTGAVRHADERSLLIELAQLGPGCYVRLSLSAPAGG